MERPSLSIRSTRGCWTCRLRKKKCDEIQPGCERCASVNVECHYGVKPAWIEDPALGKTELERIKKIVAVVASRKRAEHRVKARSGSINKSGSQPSPSTPRFDGSRGFPESSSSSALQSPAPTVDPVTDKSWLLKWNSQEEANLIMHYLDHVFYIQFRFYTPAISQGNRGWFLSLLTKTKPLHHAALSLSAFHQQSLSRGQRSGHVQNLQQLEIQHNLTLKELQLFIQAESQTTSSESRLERNVQILACIVLLISFELFHGGTSNWPVHLRAAADTVLTLHELQQPQSPTTEQHSPFPINSPGKTAAEFFSSCVIWYDCLSCISLGQPTRLTPHYERLLFGSILNLEQGVDLSPISGCSTWVAIMIGQLATISTTKDSISALEVYDEFNGEAVSMSTLEGTIRVRLTAARNELEKFRNKFGGCPAHWQQEDYSKHTILVVTYVFVTAMSIQLESIKTIDKSGVPQVMIEEAIYALKMVPEPAMHRALVWPICVAGCMASTVDDQAFFRSTIESAKNDSKSFGNSSITHLLLELSWTLQRERGYPVDCTTTIKEFQTDGGILLV